MKIILPSLPATELVLDSLSESADGGEDGNDDEDDGAAN